MFSFKNNAKAKEILFWGCLATIIAGIAYLIFIPEKDEALCKCNNVNEDDDIELAIIIQ